MPKCVLHTLESLRVGLCQILGDKIVGIYLHGSIATGDFRLKSSDIDYVVLLKGVLSTKEFEKLGGFHNKLFNEESIWGKRLEGSYVTEEMIISKSQPQSPRAYYNSGVLKWEEYGAEWIFERYILRNSGIVLFGELIKTKLEPISSLEIQNAAKELLKSWWKPLIENQVDILTDEYLAYAVLTMCRIECSIITGEVKSKKESAQWMMKYVRQDKIALINDALSWEKGQSFKYEEEAMNFINDTLSKNIS